MKATPGATATIEVTVAEPDLAVSLGSGDVPALGTPRLVALCEAATVAAVAPLLEAGETTVGARVDIRHLSPSPLGARLQTSATLTEVTGSLLSFDVAAYQGSRKIGAGKIDRMLVDRRRFLARMEDT